MRPIKSLSHLDKIAIPPTPRVWHRENVCFRPSRPKSSQVGIGPSWSYDACPLLGLAVPERIVAIPPTAEIRTATPTRLRKRSWIKIIVGSLGLFDTSINWGRCKFLSNCTEFIGFAGKPIGEGSCQLSNRSKPPRPVIWRSNGRALPPCQRSDFFG